MEKPHQSKVSIVVPVYNKITFIDMMLDSVYKQLWDNIELILVNDGATDGTRERLSQWKPRFHERGFDVVIIDQKNQGIPSAVRAGLLRITGDYVCLADCDDKLEPEYASTMAGWLDEHPDDQWVACLYNRILIKGDTHRLVSTIDSNLVPSPPLMMEKYLSSKYITEVWIYMVRTSYLWSCKTVENFITDIRSTQEPGFLFPLIACGGKLKVIDQPLYNHYCYPTQTSAHNSGYHAIAFQNGYRDIIKKNIDRLDVDYSLKEKWWAITELAHKSFLVESLKKICASNEQLSELAMEAAALIGTLFKPDPQITYEHILENDYGLLSIAIADCILGKKAFDGMRTSGRIIGCGAFGEMGRKRLPSLIGTPLEPVELWDDAASRNSCVCGIAVTLPDYDSLKSNDIVIVFPVVQKIRIELYHAAKNCGVERVFFDTDICDFLSAYKYPQFYHSCKFILY